MQALSYRDTGTGIRLHAEVNVPADLALRLQAKLLHQCDITNVMLSPVSPSFAASDKLSEEA